MKHLKLFEYNIDDELTIGDVLYYQNGIEIIIDYDENYVWRVDEKFEIWKTKTGIIMGNIYHLAEIKLINIVEFLKNNPKHIDFVQALYDEGKKGHMDFYTLYDEWCDNDELQVIFNTKKYNM